MLTARLRARGLASLGAILVAACAVVGTAPAPAAAAEKVVIGVSSRSFNPGFSNMWIGIPLGLYGPTLAASAVGTQGASENLQLLLSGAVTMGTGIQDVLLAAQAEGRTLPVVIPCVYVRGMIHRVSVLPDSPIKSFADLAGKTVGVPTLAAGQVPYLKYAAKAAGINPDAIRMVAVGYGQQAAVALTTKQVDALAHIDVDVARLGSLGIKTRELAQPDAIRDAAVAYVFAFTRPWFAAHKAAATDLLKGMIRAMVVMLENPEAAVRISYHMYPEGVPSGVPMAKAVNDALLTIKARAPAIDREKFSSKKWCDFSPAAWNQYIGVLGLEGRADASKFYTDELIGAVNNFDEAALRTWARGLKVPESAAEFQTWSASLKPPL
ncbi:MAG: ABC transporter substrate-binding protein [Variibacter sp.]|nr:ABC transporter substrate-binding protein [Variibacter sp.]